MKQSLKNSYSINTLDIHSFSIHLNAHITNISIIIPIGKINIKIRNATKIEINESINNYKIVFIKYLSLIYTLYIWLS